MGAARVRIRGGFYRPKPLHTLRIRLAASSTSAAVVVTPKLKRSALEITAGSQPIAMCVGDGSLEPLAHAEPVEQATPAWSSAMNSICRSKPTKAMFDVFGRRTRLGTKHDCGRPAGKDGSFEMVAELAHSLGSFK